MTNLLDLLDQAKTHATSTPDRWLINHLIATGHLTETGLGRRARLRTCHCGQPILAGLDDDTGALETHTDPIPLTPLGEMLARIEGRWTYDLRRQASGWVIDRRHASRIAFAPATTSPRTDTIREHRCHTRQLAAPEIHPTTFAEARPATLPPGSPAPF